MGCNFYLTSKPCTECGSVSSKRHIGKSSKGWQFHFRGYIDECITSYSDWLKLMMDDIIKDGNKQILDEYGHMISIEEFQEMVRSKEGGLCHFNIVMHTPKTKAEIEYLKDRTYNPPDAYRRHWRDPEGFSFTDAEFS